MKSQVLTYRQFINEAYIDASGELQDFEYPRGDESQFQLIDHAHRIQEYLEESGANRVRLKVDGGILEFKFNYGGSNYLLKLDIDEDRVYLSIGSMIIYEDSTDSFFDLIAETGLEFLNY
jgi:hypothetical protein